MTTLKIEAGKYYKTRGGRKAYIGYEREDDTLGRPFFGHIEGEIKPMLWDDDGWQGPRPFETEGDLVEEWKEPLSGTFWVNIDKNGGTLPFLTRESADRCAYLSRAACVKVNWTEGEFDNE